MRWRGSARARICSARASCSTGGSTGVSEKGREAVILRLKDWLRAGAEAALGPLRAAGHAAQDPAAPAAVRALLAMLVDEGGIVAARGGRRAARRARPGAAARGHPARRPDRRARPVHARRAEARGDALARRLPRRRGGRGDAGAAAAFVRSCCRPRPTAALLARLGFRAAGPQMIRVDMAERIAAHAHEARAGKPQPRRSTRRSSPRSACSRRRWRS